MAAVLADVSNLFESFSVLIIRIIRKYTGIFASALGHLKYILTWFITFRRRFECNTITWNSIPRNWTACYLIRCTYKLAHSIFLILGPCCIWQKGIPKIRDVSFASSTTRAGRTLLQGKLSRISCRVTCASFVPNWIVITVLWFWCALGFKQNQTFLLCVQV